MEPSDRSFGRSVAGALLIVEAVYLVVVGVHDLRTYRVFQVGHVDDYMTIGSGRSFLAFGVVFLLAGLLLIASAVQVLRGLLTPWVRVLAIGIPAAVLLLFTLTLFLGDGLLLRWLVAVAVFVVVTRVAAPPKRRA